MFNGRSNKYINFNDKMNMPPKLLILYINTYIKIYYPINPHLTCLTHPAYL